MFHHYGLHLKNNSRRIPKQNFELGIINQHDWLINTR